MSLEVFEINEILATIFSYIKFDRNLLYVCKRWYNVYNSILRKKSSALNFEYFIYKNDILNSEKLLSMRSIKIIVSPNKKKYKSKINKFEHIDSTEKEKLLKFIDNF
jgi:hypothetical protein